MVVSLKKSFPITKVRSNKDFFELFTKLLSFICVSNKYQGISILIMYIYYQGLKINKVISKMCQKT